MRGIEPRARTAGDVASIRPVAAGDGVADKLDLALGKGRRGEERLRPHGDQTRIAKAHEERHSRGPKANGAGTVYDVAAHHPDMLVVGWIGARFVALALHALLRHPFGLETTRDEQQEAE